MTLQYREHIKELSPLLFPQASIVDINLANGTALLAFENE